MTIIDTYLLDIFLTQVFLY